MDALSDVLRAVRLSGAFFFDVHARAPVGGGDAARQERGGRDVSGPARITSSPTTPSWKAAAGATLEGEAPIKLDAGDIVVLPHGDTHVFATELRHAPAA